MQEPTFGYLLIAFFVTIVVELAKNLRHFVNNFYLLSKMFFEASRFHSPDKKWHPISEHPNMLPLSPLKRTV